MDKHLGTKAQSFGAEATYVRKKLSIEVGAPPEYPIIHLEEQLVAIDRNWENWISEERVTNLRNLITECNAMD